MDHVPPPAYSVTDPALSPTTSNLDNASVAGRQAFELDAASSTDDPIIYTPLHSPDGSCHLNDADHVSSSAAAAATYFESRPVQQLCTDRLLLHEITLTQSTQTIDLPFPQPEKKWLERDVLPQDWETFINYLIPHHADVSNHEVADRKAKDEMIDEKMSRLTLEENDPSRMNLDDWIEAQLEPLRRSHTQNSNDNEAKSMIALWNEGFFGPRGVFIDLVETLPEEDLRRMPGSWTNDQAEPAGIDQQERPQCTSRRSFGNGWMRADNTGFHLGRNLICADNNGFRMGKNGIVADNNGFRIGNLLVADKQGFKLGPIRADSAGFRIGGTNRERHVPQEHHRSHHSEHHAVHIPPVHIPQVHIPPVNTPQFDIPPLHIPQVDMPQTGRGRQHSWHSPTGVHQRNRSHSTSSSSSSSSSASIESAGSLPNYDQLDVNQLPVARQYIKQWLSHPEQPVTKNAVKEAAQAIKAAKCGEKTLDEEDQIAMRQEVWQMLKDFKTMKKSQKQERKAAKKERRMRRKEAKSARKATRNAKKEAKKLQKKQIKEGKRKENISTSLNPAWPGFTEVPTPPGAWPLDNGSHGFPHPLHDMQSFGHIPPIPPMMPSFAGRGWPFPESSQSPDATKAAQLQAEGMRIQAEAYAHSARSQAEQTRQQAQVSAEIARNQALAEGEKARVGAEEVRQRAQAGVSIARQKADATRVQADAVRMQADVDRMRTQAGTFGGDDKARLKLLDVAEELEEEAEKLRREGERLMAEAVQWEEDLANE
jgi:hypothetical protein